MFRNLLTLNSRELNSPESGVQGSGNTKKSQINFGFSIISGENDEVIIGILRQVYYRLAYLSLTLLH